MIDLCAWRPHPRTLVLVLVLVLFLAISGRATKCADCFTARCDKMYTYMPHSIIKDALSGSLKKVKNH